MPEFLTATEFAAALGIDARTVRDQIRRGVIAARKFGKAWLVPTSELDGYRAAHLGRPGRKAAAASGEAQGSVRTVEAGR